MNGIFISQRVIYKRSWLDWLRGKVFADGGFLRESRSNLIYTENVGRYYTLFAIDSTPLTHVYYMVDGVMVSGNHKYRLPAWIVK